MAGNLKALLGADSSGTPDIDTYAHFLRTVGEPLIPYGVVLWAARVILLASLIIHVIVVVQLAVANRGARPVTYARYRTRASSFAAKSMMVTGVIILAFVVLHVLHLTTGTIRVGSFEHGAVYSNLYESFRRPVAAIAYIGFMLFVASHVWHGGWSFFQTFGIDRPTRNPFLRQVAIVVAIAIGLGFSLIPFLFLFDLLPSPQELMESSKASRNSI
jgi:succinate dehydrogenase / fumarate reductase cytochrome b subunit